nr:kelch repeat-containing protein [uncultured Carboxylicivirga sp.]
MKTIATFFYLFFTVLMFAQSGAPQHFNYQTLIRNSDGTYVANTDVYIRLSILGESPNGAVLYNEVHQVTTNDYGLISLKVGEGSSTDHFTSIDWGNTTMFVKVEASIGDDQNYFEVGTNPFSSVPYALYAEKTGTDYKVPSGTGILSFNPEAPEGYGFSGNYLTTKKLDAQWEEVSSMNYAKRYAANCSSDGYVYVLGGETSSAVASDLFERYDVKSDTWEELNTLPYGVRLACATDLNGMIYLAGGIKSGYSVSSNELYSYNPTTNEWKQETSMISGRRSAGLVNYGGKLFIVGGLQGDNIVMDVEGYDPVTATWSKVTELPEEVIGAKCAVLGDKIFVIGGYTLIDGNYNYKNEVYSYDVVKDVWQREEDIRMSRRDFTAHSGDGYIVIAGGLNSDGLMSETEVYSENTKRWIRLGDLTYPRITINGAFCDGYFFVLGGKIDSNGSFVRTVERTQVNVLVETMFIHQAE